jgi:hypothetical protein
MKITFLKDYQGPQSGNELYRTGAEADLPAAAWLVGEGHARVGWGSEETVAPATPTGPDYAAMSYKQLQAAAKADGIKANQPRARLIEALIESG